MALLNARFKRNHLPSFEYRLLLVNITPFDTIFATSTYDLSLVEISVTFGQPLGAGRPAWLHFEHCNFRV